MALRIVSPDGYKEAAPYLPVDFCRWRPSIGESILALGYADLDDDKGIHDEGRPISQYLYGSIGAITDIESADGTRSSPWPMIRIDANWPGGRCVHRPRKAFGRNPHRRHYRRRRRRARQLLP